MITLECEECGNEFKTYPAYKDKRRFCSRECFYKWENKKIVKECKQCGKKIKVPPSEIGVKFCSEECKGKYMAGKNHPNWVKKIEKKCKNCGDFFKVPPSLSNRKFCSKECQYEFRIESNKVKKENNPNWKGGFEPYYGSNWNEVRKIALERDNYTCQVCDSKQNLQVHHKKPLRTFDKNEIEDKANRLDNLITLCFSCHRKVESGGLNNG